MAKAAKKENPPEPDLSRLTLRDVGDYAKELRRAQSIKEKLCDEKRGVGELEAEIKAKISADTAEKASAIVEGREPVLNGLGDLEVRLDEKRERVDTLRRALEIERERLDTVAFESFKELKRRFREIQRKEASHVLAMLRDFITTVEKVQEVEQHAEGELAGSIRPEAREGAITYGGIFPRTPLPALDDLRRYLSELKNWVAKAEAKKT